MPLSVRRCFGDVARCGDETIGELPNVIKFFHPGYGKEYTGDSPNSKDYEPPNRDALISLPAFDDGGIHYDVAHTACGVLAGNRWDGYFSLDRDGQNRVDPPADGILRESGYFFCLPSTSADPYPVVATFRDWRFPHHNLPPCWERIRPHFLGTSHRGVRRCVMTDCYFSLDNAHLVPAKQSGWYNNNAMEDCGTALSFSTDAYNSHANVITLRTDVHGMFDERHFCFVPKPCSEASQKERESSADLTTTSKTRDNALVGHVFSLTTGGELQKLWHNREAHPSIYAASLECLFARFAWTIFSPNVFRNFLGLTGESRLLLVWDEATARRTTEWRDPEKCKLSICAAKSRSESPTKRSRSAKDTDCDEDDWSDDEPRDDCRDPSPDTDSGYFGDPHWEEEERGRSRKRKYVESTSAYEESLDHRETKRVPTWR